MAALAPLAVYIPLASLAAVLVMVAWNMSEIERFRHLLKGPSGDAAVLILTFLLTVLVDLTVGIAVGVVLASVLFVRRMALAVEIVAVAAAEGSNGAVGLIEEDINDFARPATDRYTTRMELPPGVEIYEIRGPFFFGVAARLGEVLDRIAGPPRVFILGMHNVPLIDASGATALQEFMARCRRHDTALILAGVRPQLRSMLGRMGIAEGDVTFAETRDAALALAGRLATGEAEAGGAAARSIA
jgi:SulP family sulfate permease